jgi:FemAB-related protein (PEP-CTERM system-associated)
LNKAITISIATTDDRYRWDAYVDKHRDCGPYHYFAWGDAIEHTYHHRLWYLIADDNTHQIQGVLPLCYIKPPALHGSLVSLPFCDYGGALGENSDVVRSLLENAQEHAGKLKALLEIRCKDSVTVFDRMHFGVSSHKVRMILDLPDNSEILWNDFKSKLKNQIRKPQKDGLKFKIGTQELIEDFYSVFRINMRNLGSPVHSRAWIAAVMDYFGARAHIGVVYCDDKPVAAGIVLNCREMVSIPWASALSEYSKSSPNMLLYWGFLRYACDNGFKCFDFGRSTPGEGTYKFKEQWGACPFPLYWYGEGFADDETPSLASGRLRDLIAKIWPRIPQTLVDKAGPILRKYITL